MVSTKKEPTPMGKLVRQLRLAKRMQKTSLARLAGFKVNIVDDLENGWSQKTHPANVEAMARVLEVPLEHLLNAEKYLEDEPLRVPDELHVDLGDDEETQPERVIRLAPELEEALVRALNALASLIEVSVAAVVDAGKEVPTTNVEDHEGA